MGFMETYLYNSVISHDLRYECCDFNSKITNTKRENTKNLFGEVYTTIYK